MSEAPEMILCQDCGHRMYRHDPYVGGDGCAGVAATETEPGYECACSLSIVEIARAAGAAAERERAKGLVEAMSDLCDAVEDVQRGRRIIADVTTTRIRAALTHYEETK